VICATTRQFGNVRNSARNNNNDPETPAHGAQLAGDAAPSTSSPSRSSVHPRASETRATRLKGVRRHVLSSSWPRSGIAPRITRRLRALRLLMLASGCSRRVVSMGICRLAGSWARVTPNFRPELVFARSIVNRRSTETDGVLNSCASASCRPADASARSIEGHRTGAAEPPLCVSVSSRCFPPPSAAKRLRMVMRIRRPWSARAPRK
jgi:hypothetical protein